MTERKLDDLLTEMREDGWADAGKMTVERRAYEALRRTIPRDSEAK